MKRINLIILAVVSILSSGISCQKANDIEKHPLSTVALSIIPDFVLQDGGFIVFQSGIV